MRRHSGSTRLAATLAAALASGGALCAQMPDKSGLVKVEVYHEATSRLLFVCIDANADDRLNLSEAGQALETVAGIRDRTSFRRLDQNRDGFLSWPEFDAHLREVIRSGESFYLHPKRPELLRVDMVVSPEPEKDPTVMGLVDRDHSGTLSREEVLVLLNATGLDPGVIEQFPLLDLDGSGTLSPAEAAPLSVLLLRLTADYPTDRETLPPAYRRADRNGDGHLDLLELDVCLRMLDPGLGRWSDKVLKDADPDGSGTLDQEELQRAGKR